MLRPWCLIVVVVTGVMVLGMVTPAAAQTPSPTASPVLTVDGEVTGGARVGGELSVRVDASMQGGWRAIHQVDVAIAWGGKELERVSLDVDNARLVVGGHYLLVGTEAVGVGSHLRVPASEVVITTGGDHLAIVLNADVIEAIPEDARFRLSATDDAGATRAVVRDLSHGGSGGIGWGAVVAIVVAAVFVGAFAGNTFASRRRPPPRLSVYGAVQRRIDDTRTREGPT